MKRRSTLLRRRVLAAATGGLMLLSGCGLSDYDLAQIWVSVLSAGLNTVVEGALTNAFGLTQTQTGTGTQTTGTTTT